MGQSGGTIVSCQIFETVFDILNNSSCDHDFGGKKFCNVMRRINLNFPRSNNEMQFQLEVTRKVIIQPFTFT